MGLEDEVRKSVKDFCGKRSGTREQIAIAAARQELIRRIEKAMWIEIIQEWQRQKPENFPIPELIGSMSIREIFGTKVYRSMGISQDCSRDLLTVVFPDYGKFDDRKCEIYVKRKDARHVLPSVFFEGEHAEDNAKMLLNYMWNKYWCKIVPIPELLSHRNMKETVGWGVYRGLKISVGDAQSLLRKALDEYGIMTEEKCRVYIERKKRNVRDAMIAAFFTGEEGRENLKRLVLYAWEHFWKEQWGCPELIRYRAVQETIGTGFYSALGIKPYPQELFKIAFDDYGVLTEEKERIIQERWKSLAPGEKWGIKGRFKGKNIEEDNGESGKNLLERLKARDKDAYLNAYKKCAEQIVEQLLPRTKGDRERAEEITNDFFLSLYETKIDRWTERGRSVEDEIIARAVAHAAGYVPVEKKPKPNFAQLKELGRRLPDSERTCIVFRYNEHFSYKKIAEIRRGERDEPLEDHIIGTLISIAKAQAALRKSQKQEPNQNVYAGFR